MWLSRSECTEHTWMMWHVYEVQLSLGTNVFILLSLGHPPSAVGFKRCCFEIPCKKQSSVLLQTIKQLDFCTCAFVLLWGLVITPSEGWGLHRTRTRMQAQIQATASARRMAVSAQKNIWFAYKYRNMKEKLSRVKGRGQTTRGVKASSSSSSPSYMLSDNQAVWLKSLCLFCLFHLIYFLKVQVCSCFSGIRGDFWS